LTTTATPREYLWLTKTATTSATATTGVVWIYYVYLGTGLSSTTSAFISATGVKTATAGVKTTASTTAEDTAPAAAAAALVGLVKDFLLFAKLFLVNSPLATHT
jgi:hypothetical protein